MRQFDALSLIWVVSTFLHWFFNFDYGGLADFWYFGSFVFQVAGEWKIGFPETYAQRSSGFRLRVV